MPTKQAATNLPAAGMAVAYVRSKMDSGASNKVGPGMVGRLLCAGGTFSKGRCGREWTRSSHGLRQPTVSAIRQPLWHSAVQADRWHARDLQI